MTQANQHDAFSARNDKNEVCSTGSTADNRTLKVENGTLNENGKWPSFSVAQAPSRGNSFERGVALQTFRRGRWTNRQRRRACGRFSPSPKIDLAIHICTSGISLQNARGLPKLIINYS